MEPLKMTHEQWLDRLNSDLQVGPSVRYEIEPCGIRAAIHDGDGGGLMIDVADSGEILSLKLHECSFFGESYVTVDDLVDWLEHILRLLESEKFSNGEG
jgi:hypothetical protein